MRNVIKAFASATPSNSRNSARVTPSESERPVSEEAANLAVSPSGATVSKITSPTTVATLPAMSMAVTTYALIPSTKDVLGDNTQVPFGNTVVVNTCAPREILTCAPGSPPPIKIGLVTLVI